MSHSRRGLLLCLPMVLLLALCGCSTTRESVRHRPFDFQKDTFAYPNELRWEYGYAANGKWTGHLPEHKKERPYALHCFVVARSATQFYKFAKFEPTLPVVNDARYRQLVRKVVHTYPNHLWPEDKRIVIPGYSNLKEFSAAHEKLLKAECGSAMQSYFQRGHWRMIFPFSRRQQLKTANRLIESVERDGIAVVHLLRFPSLRINHAVLLYGAKETTEGVVFSTYDPNDPSTPTILTFDRKRRQFQFPANKYFPGGPLKVYQVYHRWNY